MAEVIDWGLAQSTGIRLAKPGPEVTSEQAREVVAELRQAADAAIAPVAEVTGLICPPDSASTVVVDRPGWITSNVAGFRSVVGPALDRLAPEVSPAAAHIGGRVTGLQLGAILAWLSGKVLGQYEAFVEPGLQPRLLLVAPNVRAAERTLDLVPADFRLWVALHEETHRAQFGAVPWLSSHLREQIDELLALTQLDSAELASRLLAGARSVAAGGSIADALQSEEQRAAVDRITAVMSLLEGHADHVMDVAAPQLIPTLPVIRERFDSRRHSPSFIEGFVRRVLGLDAKMRQYSDGAAFVRAVIERAGDTGFEEVWRAPSALPSLEEIHTPVLWVDRVLEGRAR